MTPGARLAASLDLLTAIAGDPRPADAVAQTFLRARRYIGAGDRRAVTERVYGLLRRHARLGWWTGHGTPRDRLIADLVLTDGLTVKAIKALFSGQGHEPEPLTGPERTLAERLQGQPLEPPEMPEADRLELPEWLLEPLSASLSATVGPDWRAALAALNGEAPLDLRVNTLKADREGARAALAEADITAVDGPLAPLALRVEGRVNLAATAPFRDGLVEVQDAGSQVAAALVGATPGMAVCDLCAGAGGKTLALAAAMAGKGRLLACDVSAPRLDRAKVRLRRAGVHNATLHVLDESGRKWLKRQAGAFDRVLVDAPCSGTGAWRRNPDARWRLDPEDLVNLAAEQDAILVRAARLVRPGGRLIYVTCSVLTAENEDRVAAFLTGPAGAGFAPVPVVEAWAEAGLPPDTCPAAGDALSLRLVPSVHATDGFFAAVLRRAEE
ncbi:RsmB/NOP family class I SAM-dependent RNA methyltransferase [Roseospira marina]|uniref:RsmB/NOP family class I SAM-dependent RNA methyltransferase n=1 Tax=Roseospira marina TaxID=140057 RepID=A0A5M6IFI9_9PROT|nr:RsmB/NOP family class I SAM-dependent RNA methyltransferase [Roseospira marina]KAA5606495.1 RsmB/NOP family class I SAM-dependent RNA methyltransferase [Roseospira marina]MBB4314083.1 16S rRNA (cytosine967-C5)-methyltransferase [Roseospira marina]MBB5087244.1 16S rRNA (cytosine967-C5)-methyltransferase [Roseospira marina]